MIRPMYDAVTPGNIPAGAQLVAGYADGRYANLPAMRARFPHALVVPIATGKSTRATVADVEKGDLTPEDALYWVTVTMSDVSNHLLTLYANTSTWPSVKSAFTAARVTLPQWWAAHYTGVAHLEPGSIATQYVDTGGYDLSLVADYWPGVDPLPTPPAAHTQKDTMIIVSVARKGYTDANWPGDFLLTSTGALRHITAGNLKAFESKYGAPIQIDQAQYESLLASK